MKILGLIHHHQTIISSLNHDQRLKVNLHKQANADRNDRLDGHQKVFVQQQSGEATKAAQNHDITLHKSNLITRKKHEFELTNKVLSSHGA
ncbi:hypothetical protein AVEN_231479-1 [Araneus ventricosus]|uniref:Uncharacterized protein n=1 Tax=Araneus ventricosus TaxID=182803 RepID=A0A4Y2IYM1_ARAVE|nr:hypothetical protein AVEN_231479-1 [Araneus ventricosus]